MTDFYDEPEGEHPAAEYPRGFGPIFMADYHSEDSCCDEGIQPGEDIRADGRGGWIHADDQCEKIASTVPGETLDGARAQICRACFLVHAPNQEGCQ
jgi:hypothetical protein